jgi:F-type H+-transporting ATPase subunit b
VRIRKGLAATFVVAAALFGPAAVAYGAETGDEPGVEAEEEHDISHAAEECIHLLEDGGEPDDCNEAPSPILPATDELVWGGISFVILFALLAKFAYPAMKQGMEARTERIRSSLDEAESAKATAQQVLDDYQRQLADARGEAARILEEARQAADAMRKDLLQRAEADATATRERAQADIQVAVDRAKADLQAQVATLAVDLAEKVVAANLDRDAQMRLIENYINEVNR